MLTTTLDGLWALQVLSGYEVLAPELGLRPYLPSAESIDDALSHPVARDLRAAGLIDEAGVVDTPVFEWLSVLARREVGLLMRVQTPNASEPERILLARHARWWIVLQRCGSMIRLGGLGNATTENSARDVLYSVIEQLCGRHRPAQFSPATLDLGKLVNGVRGPDSLPAQLAGQGLDADQIRMLLSATDPQRSAHACVVALQSGLPTEPAGSFVGPEAFSIIDTTEGRLLSEQVERDGRRWMIVAPGSRSSIASAMQTMLRRLPAGSTWHENRRALQ